jgi:hypothetical protein
MKLINRDLSSTKTASPALAHPDRKELAQEYDRITTSASWVT